MTLDETMALAYDTGSSFWIETDDLNPGRAIVTAWRGTQGDFYAVERCLYYELGDRAAARLFNYVDENGMPR